MSGSNYWKIYWNQQTTPLHRYNNEDWYKMYAQEINLILESVDYPDGLVMETGCGNGALFDYLRIDKSRYLGTDISESLLKIFQDKHPEVSLLCVDSSDYEHPKKVSVIFSNGVIQYFNKKMLDRYIKQSLKMLNTKGILLMANIPWKDLKMNFLSGELSENIAQISFGRYLKSTLKYYIQLLSGKDSMGNWYNPRDFKEYKSACVDVTILGSLFHPYRFSVILRKQ